MIFRQSVNPKNGRSYFLPVAGQISIHSNSVIFKHIPFGQAATEVAACRRSKRGFYSKIGFIFLEEVHLLKV